MKQTRRSPSARNAGAKGRFTSNAERRDLSRNRHATLATLRRSIATAREPGLRERLALAVAALERGRA